MSSSDKKLPRVKDAETDPLAIDGVIQIKQEIDDEIDDFGVSKTKENEIIIKKEPNDDDLNDTFQDFTSSRKQIVISNLPIHKNKVIKILPLAKQAQSTEGNPDTSNRKAIKIKKEAPCNCMQNVEYYCNKCEKTLTPINKAQQCSVCNSQLKLQCRLCRKRYKLLKSLNPRSISKNIKKEIDIKEEEHFSCFKCNFKTTEKSLLDDHIIEKNHQADISITNGSSTVSKNNIRETLYCTRCDFSTKIKEDLNNHIFKSHWQPKYDVKINCDDDMYIELLCKKCQKVCRKVVYDDMVKLVCRECQIPMLYRCTLCRNSYKLLKNVRYHVKCVCPYRKNNEKFYCAECAFKAGTKAGIEDHIRKKHLNQKCLNCHQILEDNDALRKHALEYCTVKKVNVQPTELELPFREPIDDDEKFVIVRHNPNVLTKSIVGKPPKDTKEWGTLIDYLCLECGDEAKKKFARYRPWCKKCNLKYDYRCISCEKLYGNYDRIHHHVKVSCPNRIVFECPLCKFNASKKSLLLNHVETLHTVYKCMECFVNVEGSLALKKHQAIDCFKDRPKTDAELEQWIRYYCKQCYKKPNKATNTTAVKCEKCDLNLSYQCLKCRNGFESRDIAFKHLKELCKPNFSCQKCHFKTYTEEGLEAHTKYKHLVRNCPDCGVNFKDELIFQLHRREEIRRKRKEEFTGIPLIPKRSRRTF